MKTNLTLTAAIFFAGSLVSAQAGAKDDVTNAIKKLSEKGNYSWISTTKRPERPDSTGGNSNRWRSGPTTGKTADGLVYLKSTRGERTSESLVKGKRAATKGEEGWTLVEERPATGATGDNAGQGRQRGGRGRGRSLLNFKSPSVQAEELLAKVGELKKDGDVYTGDLNEEAAKALVSFGGGRARGGADAADAPARPQPTGVKATAKFWIKDGVLSKYETVVAGKIKFNEQERDLARTSSVEIKDVGSTKIDVPEDTKKKLSEEKKPAAVKAPEAKSPAAK